MSLESADRWTKVMLHVGWVLAAALLAADLSFWIAKHAPAFTRPFDGLAIALVSALVVISAFGRFAVWMVRDQRRLTAQVLRGGLPEPRTGEHAVPEGVVRMPSPDTVEAVRRLARKVTSER